MEDEFRYCLWVNFAASIDMLMNVVRICPESLWKRDTKFYFMTYHTVIFLDYYLTYPVVEFEPLLRYTIVSDAEIPSDAIDDVLPIRKYSQDEIISYLWKIRVKCNNLTGPESNQDLLVKWINKAEIPLHGLCPSIVEEYSILEILFYNLRHVQHHVAQLNFILRSEVNRASDWISHAN